MSVTLTGTGGLFTRLGLIIGAMNNVNGYIGATAPNPGSAWGSGGPAIKDLDTQIDGINAQYASALQDLMDGLYQARDGQRSAQSGFKASMQQLAQNTLIEQVNADIKLDQLTVDSAMKELIRQMTGAATVQASTVAAGTVTAVGAPNGDPAIIFSTLDVNGKSCEYAIPEVIHAVCTSDSQQGATAGSETLTFTGQNANGDPLAWDWPYGSGASLALTTADPTQDNQGGFSNLLTNSDFETATTTNYPDNWVRVTGIIGTDILRSATHYSGSYSLAYVGDGSTLCDAYQEFNHAVSTSAGAGGTPAALEPSTQYAFSCRVRVSAAPSTGAAVVTLTDGTDTITADAASTNNSIAIDLTAQTSAWVIIKGTFRTPAVMPAALRLHLTLGTAIEAGKSAFFDHFCLQKMQQLYSGGPSIAAASGATILINGLHQDTWTAAITNTWGSFQKGFQRFFGMTSLGTIGYILPSAGSPTIADTLVA